MTFLRHMILSCSSFDAYKEIVSQPKKKSLLYFFFLIVLASFLIYPKDYRRTTGILFPILDEMAEKFPILEFKEHQIITEFKEPVLLTTPGLSIVVDPSNQYESGFFSGLRIFFKKETLQIQFSPENKTTFPYKDHFMKTFFMQYAQFVDGEGTLDGHFFLQMKTFFETFYFHNGFFFFLKLLLLGFIGHFLTSLFAQTYSKMLNTGLEKTQIRNLGYYAITPVIVFLILCYWLSLDILTLQPLLMLMYLLFMRGVLLRFKGPSDEESIFA